MAETIQQDPSLSQISMGAGIDLGNPMLNMVAQMLLGRYMTPRPIPGSAQSIYDASLQRERSMEFMQLSQAGLFNNAARKMAAAVWMGTLTRVRMAVCSMALQASGSLNVAR